MKLTVLRNNQPEFDYETPTLKESDSFEIYIGRADDCHIQLDNHLISRHHVLLTLRDGKWLLDVLSDFGGVTVNGSDVDKHELSMGDRIVIDDFIINVSNIEFELDDPLPVKESEDNSLEEAETTEIPDENELTVDSDLGEDVEESNVGAGDDFDTNEESLDDEESDNYDPDGGLFDSEESENTDETPEEESLDFNNDEGSEENSYSDDEGDGFGGDEEGGFGGDDDGFGGGFDEDVSGGGFDDHASAAGESTRVFSGFAKYELIISGEHAQYDRFALDENEITIGRDQEKCQIFLNDPEVSTEHAKIKKTLISVTLEDLGSSNGTILNGSRINSAELVNGDVFTIGSTTFEVAIVSELLDAEEDYLMPVEDDQEITIEEIVEEEVDFDDMDEGEYDGDFSVEGVEEEPKSLLKKALLPKNRVKTAIVVALLLALLMSEDDGKKKKGKDKKKAKDVAQKPVDKKPTTGKKRNYTKAQLEELQASYALARQYFSEGAYSEAQLEIAKVIAIDAQYKEALLVKTQIDSALARLEEEKRRQDEEKARLERMTRVKILLEKAREQVKNKEMKTAQAVLGEITKLDPENIEVPQLKLEIEAFLTDERLKKEAERLKKQERAKMVDQKKPGDLAFSKQKWHEAIIQFEKYISIKGIDEDLVADASEKLKQSRANLESQLSPMLGKARSLKEAQDLKSSYEEYKKILDLNPALEEALIEMEEIRITLENRSKLVYREALISESLSLFEEAKEKFKEVQQISPSDSEYYEKATRKLKNYLE